jgi:ABC-type nickel/cobalt efflux system permease component RcnA
MDNAMPYNYGFIRSAMQRQERMRLVGDYMRYTFTAAFGIVQSMGALVTLIIMVLVRNNPLLILEIFCLYVGIFLVAMVISFFAWRKHRRFYKSVFK